MRCYRSEKDTAAAANEPQTTVCDPSAKTAGWVVGKPVPIVEGSCLGDWRQGNLEVSDPGLIFLAIFVQQMHNTVSSRSYRGIRCRRNSSGGFFFPLLWAGPEQPTGPALFYGGGPRAFAVLLTALATDRLRDRRAIVPGFSTSAVLHRAVVGLPHCVDVAAAHHR